MSPPAEKYARKVNIGVERSQLRLVIISINPLYQPVSDVMDRHGERHTPRKVCCVRYRIECLGYCSNCPLSIERATARRAQTRRVDQRANSRAALIGSDLS